MKRILTPLLLLLCMHGNAQLVIRDAAGSVFAYQSANGKIFSAAPSVTYVEPVPEDSLTVQEDTASNELSVEEIFQSLDTIHVSGLLNISNTNTILDPTGLVIAVFNPLTKELIDTNGDLVFKLNEMNQIINSADDIIAHIGLDGKVFGADGNLMGQGNGISPFKLAYLFFHSNK